VHFSVADRLLNNTIGIQKDLYCLLSHEQSENWTHTQINQYYSMPQNSKRGKNMNGWHIFSSKFETTELPHNPTTAITAKGVLNFLDT
jgi:hypothetical protein